MEIVVQRKVIEFIEELPVALSARVRKSLLLLQSHGHLLRFPDSRVVASGLFEFRVVGAIHIRLLYFFHEDKAIIVHAFTKKRRAIIRKDIIYALQKRKEWLA